MPGLRVATALGTVLLIALVLHSPAHAAAATPAAQGAEIVSFMQRDLNGDAQPDLALITAVYRGRRYRIEVFDRGRDMKVTNNWQDGTDFLDDLWIFKTEADGVTRLIIRFDHDNAGYSASLFDDVDGNGAVGYQQSGQAPVRLTESPFPTVKFDSKQYWILPDGRSNRSVRITSYRPMTSGTGEEPQFQNRLFQDGRPAFEQEVIDSNGDGTPDYELVRAFYNVPDTWNLFRSYILVNVDHLPVADFTDYFFWPYLGSADGNDKQQTTDFWRMPPQDGVANTTAPVQMDWDHGKIRGVAHFLPLWGLGNEWRLQSWAPLTKDQPNQLDWERFAYYSFSGHANPDMVVRLRQGYPDVTVDAGGKELHLENVALSWKYNNPGTLFWDFKLDLAGLHELPSTTVTFPDFSLREVPFAQYPAWYAGQDWAYSTLVAAEGPVSLSNEGIGEWATLHGVHTNDDLPIEENIVPGSENGQLHYLMGDSSVSPASYYTRIKGGLRGEYADLNGRPPLLYLSAIDHKLHLLHAGTGLWNLGDGREIHYENLGGDYLNQWDLVKDGKSLGTLRYLAGQLIVNETNTVRITPAAIGEAVFTSSPPRNQQEWTSLGDQLARAATGIKPDDLNGMYDQFGRPGTVLTGAFLHGFRAAGSGFRFMLTLAPSFTIAGPDLLGLQGTPPGDYLVTYEGSYKVLPAGAPQLNLTVMHDPVDARAPVTNQPESLLVTVSNTGTEDATILLRLRQGTTTHALTWSTPLTVTVRAGESLPVRSSWIPAEPGEWQVQAEARLLTGENLAAGPIVASETSYIRPAPETTVHQDVSAFGLIAAWQWVMLLGSLLLVGGAVGWRVVTGLGENVAAHAPAGSAKIED